MIFFVNLSNCLIITTIILEHSSQSSKWSLFPLPTHHFSMLSLKICFFLDIVYKLNHVIFSGTCLFSLTILFLKFLFFNYFGDFVSLHFKNSQSTSIKMEWKLRFSHMRALHCLTGKVTCHREVSVWGIVLGKPLVSQPPNYSYKQEGGPAQAGL